MKPLTPDQIGALAVALGIQPAESNGADLLKRLAEPFPAEAVSWRVGPTTADKKKGMALAYIDARDVMDRLDAVMGADWQSEYIAMPDGSYCCRLGLKIDGEWRWRSDGAVNLTESAKADAKEMAAKGCYSDAFKRAAVTWGIGRYLYSIPSPWVQIEARGNSFGIPDSAMSALRSVLNKHAAGARAAAGDQPTEQPADTPPPPKKEAPAKKGVSAPTSGKPASRPTVAPDGEPIAETLLEGIPHHSGLRAIVLQYVHATKRIELGDKQYLAWCRKRNETPLTPEQCQQAKLDAQFAEWEAWKTALWPNLPEGDQAKVMDALGKSGDVFKRFDAAVAGADPQTGEILPEQSEAA